MSCTTDSRGTECAVTSAAHSLTIQSNRIAFCGSDEMGPTARVDPNAAPDPFDPQTSLSLENHVFACMADGHVVFMNIQEDRYYCLSRSNSSLVFPQTPLTPCEHEVDALAPQLDGRAAIVNVLRTRGLLARCGTEGKPLTCTEWELPSTSFDRVTSATSTFFHLRVLHRFFWACSVASFMLNRRPIAETIESVANRRAKLVEKGTSMPLDLAVSAFLALRPLYPREYLCLFDSLALIHFLAQFGHFPHWVFGVKLEPFAAHCWVQHEALALNDVVEAVRQYTPILVA